MAIDTRDKRSSAIGVGLPWRVYPNPDSSLDQGDRQQTAFLYRGILAEENVVAETPPSFPGPREAERTPLWANQSVFVGEVLTAMRSLLLKATQFQSERVVGWTADSRPDLTAGGTIIWYRYAGRKLDAESGAGRNGVKVRLEFDINITTRGFQDGAQRDRQLMRTHLGLVASVENAFYGRMLHDEYLADSGGWPPSPKRRKALSDSEKYSRRLGQKGSPIGIISGAGVMTAEEIPAPAKPRPEQGYVESRIRVSIPIVLRVTTNDMPLLDIPAPIRSTWASTPRVLQGRSQSPPRYANQSVTTAEVLDAVNGLIIAATGFQDRRVIEWHYDNRPNLDHGGTKIWFRHVKRSFDTESGAGRHGTKTNLTAEINVTTRGFPDGAQRDERLIRDHLALTLLIENAFYGRMLHQNYLPAEPGLPPQPSRKTPLSDGEQSSRRYNDPVAPIAVVSHGGTMTAAELPEPARPRPEQGYLESRIGVDIPVVLRVTDDPEPDLEVEANV